MLPNTLKEWLITIFWSIIIYFIMSVIMSFNAEAIETDKAKWERIERNKQERRTKERAYESCVQQCIKGCTK